MALTDDTLAAAIRADAATAGRLRPVAVEVVEKYAPGAPDTVKDEAAIRLAGYLLDAPPAPTGGGYAAALVNSGGAGLLSPWRVRRAGMIGGTATAETPAAETPAAEAPAIMRLGWADELPFVDSMFRWRGDIDGVEMDTAFGTPASFGFWIAGDAGLRVIAFEALEADSDVRLSDFTTRIAYQFGNTPGYLHYTPLTWQRFLNLPNMFRVTLADA